MNKTETLTTSNTQDTGQNSDIDSVCVFYTWLSILFALVFILSCVLCIRCCQCLCFVHSWLSLLFTLVIQRHWQHRIHKTQDKINTRVNRRDNQEWKTQRHWQYRMHKTQGKINTRVNRRDNQEDCPFCLLECLFCTVSCVSDVVSVSVLFILDCPFCLH
jgi:hypothetical protein